MGRFNKDICGPLCHLAVHPAHNACNAKDPGTLGTVGGISDEQILRRQVMVFAIQGRQLLPFPGAAHNYWRDNLIKVICVKRLPQVKHSIIRRINYRGQGTHPAPLQAVCQPAGSLHSIIYPADRTRIIAVAALDTMDGLAVADNYFDITGTARIMRYSRCCPVKRLHGVCKLCPSRVMEFPGNTAIGESIPPVRGNIDLQDRLSEPKKPHKVITRFEGFILAVA